MKGTLLRNRKGIFLGITVIIIPASLLRGNLRKKNPAEKAPWQALLMERNQFSCYVCGHGAETSGPYPFMLDNNNYRVPYPDPPPKLYNGRERGFDGLYAQMYCPLCDKPASVLLSQFYRPATTEDLANGQVDAMEVEEPACAECGNKRLLYMEGSTPCPKCKEGRMILPGASIDLRWSDSDETVIEEDNNERDFVSKKSEVHTTLRSYLLIAWIPLTMLAAFVSLSSATGSVSACDNPGPDLVGFCSGPWQWLSLLASLGPVTFMLLGGYLAVNDNRKRLWPFAFGAVFAITFAYLGWMR